MTGEPWGKPDPSSPFGWMVESNVPGAYGGWSQTGWDRYAGKHMGLRTNAGVTIWKFYCPPVPGTLGSFRWDRPQTRQQPWMQA